MGIGGLGGFRNRQVLRDAAACEDVGLGCVEVGIVGDDIAWLDEEGCEDILRRAPLMSRDQVLEAEDVVEGLAQSAKGAGPRVRLVALHQC